MDFGQTKYTDHASGKQIILPFPARLLTEILNESNMDAEHLTLLNVAELFPVLVGRWLDGNVQTEELSSIANFFIGITKYENNQLINVLLAASELSYYIRHTNPQSSEPLHGFVAVLKEYYAESSRRAGFICNFSCDNVYDGPLN